MFWLCSFIKLTFHYLDFQDLSCTESSKSSSRRENLQQGEKNNHHFIRTKSFHICLITERYQILAFQHDFFHPLCLQDCWLVYKFFPHTKHRATNVCLSGAEKVTSRDEMAPPSFTSRQIYIVARRPPRYNRKSPRNTTPDLYPCNEILSWLKKVD